MKVHHSITMLSKILLLGAVAMTALTVQAELIPVKFKEGLRPPYPEEMRVTAESGEAKIRVTIDETGKVIEAEIESATHASFGESALDTVQSWLFEPATEDGVAVSQKVSIPVQFRPSIKDVISAEAGRQVFVDITKLTDKVCTWEDIKKWVPMKGKNAYRIPYPEKMKGSGISEEIFVKCIITPEGKVVNPTIVNIKNKALALPAIRQAVKTRFQIPKINGKPVYLEQKVKFICSEGPDVAKKSKKNKKN